MKCENNITQTNTNCNDYHQPNTLKISESSHCIFSGDKPFKCLHGGCNQQFTQKDGLNKHLRIHCEDKKLQCKLLGSMGNERFSSKTNLDDHIKQMLEIKSYKCSLCNKRFVRKQELTQHFQMHSGEKLFECKHCKKRFNDRSNLISHTKMIHN